MSRSACFLSLIAIISTLCACDNMPGRPKPGPLVPRPQSVLDFTALYSQNCAGCHGSEGQLGPATPLANPEYQALIDDDTLRDIIAKGQKNTMMPAFAESAGGYLSDEQVKAIVKGIRAKWSKGNVLQSLNAPPYKSDRTGDAARGKEVYEAQCARCHGHIGGPPGPKGAILNGSFLALVSDQTIRTTAIVGRPDLGMPNWRNRTPEKPMTDQELADVVSFLASQRPATPGQPYPSQRQITQNTSATSSAAQLKTEGP
jgi:cytochrome c oxidase cbb3-type subunit III